MYPHERSLVKKLADDPFAIIGVNSDADLEGLQKTLEEEKITWRSFWNGPTGPPGPIATNWGVHGWPTMYLIDHEGIIRHKWIGSPGDEVLDEAIDVLVAKAKEAGN